MLARSIMMGLALVIATAGLAQARPAGDGDFDGDNDVDLYDYAELPRCLAGPGGGLGSDCAVFDFDADRDVDLSDFAAFQRVFGTSASPAEILIPGGEFEMGCHAETGETCDPDERGLPVHDVYVDSFYMGVYEVTNRQYCNYLNSAYSQGLITVTGGTVYQAGSGISYPYCDCETTTSPSYSRINWDGATFTITTGKEDHPMVEVSWYGAAAYANWHSEQQGRTPCYDLTTWDCDFDANGYRLPTEAEWEYAARGGERNPYYTYPWGNDIDGSKANYQDSGDPFEAGRPPYTTPVGYYSGWQTPPGSDMANGYGLYDMAGNAWEWCNDWYGQAYYESSPYDNPHGPAGDTNRVLRGGSWVFDVEFLRCAYRNGGPPGSRYYKFGFRLASGT